MCVSAAVYARLGVTPAARREGHDIRPAVGTLVAGVSWTLAWPLVRRPLGWFLVVVARDLAQPRYCGGAIGLPLVSRNEMF